MTIKWEFSKRRNRQNVKNHENHKKVCKSANLQTFFQNFQEKVSRDRFSTKFDTSLNPFDVKI